MLNSENGYSEKKTESKITTPPKPPSKGTQGDTRVHTDNTTHTPTAQKLRHVT